MKGFNAEHYVLAVKVRREKVGSFDEYPFSLGRTGAVSRL
jgi:hypothetical protein